MHIYNIVMQVVTEDVVVPINDYLSLFVSFLGVVLPIFVLFDWLLDKNKKDNPTDKKTDWFYKNEQYDRKLDDRADKNNYRTM